MSQRAATAVPFHRQVQSDPQPTFKVEPFPVDKNTATANNAPRQGVRDTSKLTVGPAKILVNNDPFTLQQGKQAGGFVEHAQKNERTKQRTSGSSDVLTRKDSDDDVHMEDVPLGKHRIGVFEQLQILVINTTAAWLNIKAALKKLGATTSRDDSTGVNSSTPEVSKRSSVTKGARKTHLPSPSPSLASAPPTPTTLEATSLLNAFKKPSLTPASVVAPGARARIVESRASSCTLAQTPAPGKTTALQRQTPVISHKSHVSTLNNKRKQVDLSDDEQPDYSPSEPSSVAARRKSTVCLGSPLKKPKASTLSLAKPRGPPPPSALPSSAAGKKTNGFGLRTKATPVSASTPATPPRTSTTESKHTTPVTPTRSCIDARAKAPSTPPSKRKAAVRAQSEIKKMSEADKQFHTEDEFFRASTREARRNHTSTTELGTRLRSMSITPVPIGTHFGASRKSKMPDAPAATGDEGGVDTRKDPLKDRATGDRLAARTRNIDKIVGDDSDEDYVQDLDTSEFTYVNGIILQAGQEGRLMEVQTEAVGDGDL